MLDQVHLLADELQSFFQQEARRKLSRTKALEFCAKAYGFPTYNHVPRQAAAAVQAASNEPALLNTVNGPATISEVSAEKSDSFVERLLAKLTALSKVNGVHKIPVTIGDRPACIVLYGGPDGVYGDYSLQFWETIDGPLFYSHGDISSIDEKVVVEFLRKGALAAMDKWRDDKAVTNFKIALLEVIQSPELSLLPEYHVGLRLANSSLEFA